MAGLSSQSGTGQMGSPQGQSAPHVICHSSPWEAGLQLFVLKQIKFYYAKKLALVGWMDQQENITKGMGCTEKAPARKAGLGAWGPEQGCHWEGGSS